MPPKFQSPFPTFVGADLEGRELRDASQVCILTGIRSRSHEPISGMVKAGKSAAIRNGSSFSAFCSERVRIRVFNDLCEKGRNRGQESIVGRTRRSAPAFGGGNAVRSEKCLAPAGPYRRLTPDPVSASQCSSVHIATIPTTIPTTIRWRRCRCSQDKVRPVDAKPILVVKKISFLFESVSRRVILFAHFAALC